MLIVWKNRQEKKFGNSEEFIYFLFAKNDLSSFLKHETHWKESRLIELAVGMVYD